MYLMHTSVDPHHHYHYDYHAFNHLVLKRLVSFFFLVFNGLQLAGHTTTKIDTGFCEQ